MPHQYKNFSVGAASFESLDLGSESSASVLPTPIFDPENPNTASSKTAVKTWLRPSPPIVVLTNSYGYTTTRLNVKEETAPVN